ncbi:hypothetical protein AnigIFM59636_003062 [Aspergillus niger]|nr:hypothetical protein AnigIFM59636_003062 [Aspergillus niger]
MSVDGRHSGPSQCDVSTSTQPRSIPDKAKRSTQQEPSTAEIPNTAPDLGYAEQHRGHDSHWTPADDSRLLALRRQNTPWATLVKKMHPKRAAACLVRCAYLENRQEEWLQSSLKNSS